MITSVNKYLRSFGDILRDRVRVEICGSSAFRNSIFIKENNDLMKWYVHV